MIDTHITVDMRAAIGGLVDWRVSYPIAVSDIRRWCIATYYPDEPPRWYRDEDSTGQFQGGLVAPEEFNPFAWAVADRMTPAIVPRPRDSDRLEKAIGIRGPGLANQINGGSRARYGVPMRPGDVIRSETRLKEYRERTGRMGSMLITLTEARWTNQRDELVLTGVDTSIRY